jgi:hypothetical protein
MARKRTLSFEDLPSMDALIDKNLRLGQRLIERGRTPQEAATVLESRSIVVRQFMVQSFDLLETKDKNLLERSGKSMFKAGVASLVPAFGLNYGLSKLKGGWIFEKPFWVRFSLRTALFLAPIAYATQYCYTRYMHVSLYLEDKYADRIALFMRSEDPGIINPEGL